MPATDVLTFHELKCQAPFFERIWSGVKTFEVRKNDRGFDAGHFLLLREHREDTTVEYTRREILAHVPYLTNYAQQAGYVVMSLEVVIQSEGPLPASVIEQTAHRFLEKTKEASCEKQRLYYLPIG